jgi:hypothetical protein
MDNSVNDSGQSGGTDLRYSSGENSKLLLGVRTKKPFCPGIWAAIIPHTVIPKLKQSAD